MTLGLMRSMMRTFRYRGLLINTTLYGPTTLSGWGSIAGTDKQGTIEGGGQCFITYSLVVFGM